jgi:hypothetical protein
MKLLYHLLLISSIAFAQENIIFRDTLNNDNIIAVKNGKFGLFKEGQKTFFEYDSLYVPHYLPQFSEYIFAKKDLWGIIDLDGNTLIPYQYDFIRYTHLYVKSIEVVLVQKNNKLGTVNLGNKITVPIKYDAISTWVERGPEAHYVMKDGKMGLIKHNGKEVLPTIYDSLHYYTDKVIKGKLNNKFGVINSSNKTIIPFIYDALIADIDYMGIEGKNHKDIFVVKRDDKWDYLNMDGSIYKTGISEIEIRKKYADFELNNYDFTYVGYCLIKPK